MEPFGELLIEVLEAMVGPSSRLFPFYLLIAVGICFVIYRRRKIAGSFLSWLVPKSVYLHPSHIVDLKVFAVNRILVAVGVFNVVVFTSAIANVMAESVSLGLGIGPFHPIAIAALLMIVGDFAGYWVHRIHHEHRVLWPFHAVHHSAEVLTPLTVYRTHPVYDLISRFVRGILIGILQGLFLILFDQRPGYLTIAGINMFITLFNIAGSNLRHSHVWLSFGPVVEHILISPAQHQIHHSVEPRHQNKNYGVILAIWDWMFGTLYVPRKMEILEFGLADRNGRRLPQPHDSLTRAMVVPVVESCREIAASVRRLRREARPSRPPGEAAPRAEDRRSS